MGSVKVGNFPYFPIILRCSQTIKIRKVRLGWLEATTMQFLYAKKFLATILNLKVSYLYVLH